MANEIYPLARQAFADGDLDFTGTDWRCALLDSSYVYDPGHEFFDDLTGVVDVSGNLSGKTNVLGVCDASDQTLPAVPGGDTVTQIVVYQWTGSGATSRVVIYYDTTAAASMIDANTDGSDVTVRWSNGVTKMFRV